MKDTEAQLQRARSLIKPTCHVVMVSAASEGKRTEESSQGLHADRSQEDPRPRPDSSWDDPAFPPPGGADLCFLRKVAARVNE